MGRLAEFKFTQILCSLCTEVDIRTFKYLARYTGLNDIFDCLMQP